MRARGIAATILSGFDTHFMVFQLLTRKARQVFIEGDWQTGREAVRQRVDLYDSRVEETIGRLKAELGVSRIDQALWEEVKLQFRGLLYEHKQPELAESFYNSVFCRLFERHYYNNDNIFVRPAVSTEYIESETPSFRSYYPGPDGLERHLIEILENVDIGLPFEDLMRDADCVVQQLRRDLPGRRQQRQHFQLQVLTPLFYRNKAAYVVGRAINGAQRIPLVLPLLRTDEGSVYVDTVITNPDDVASIFSFARDYFSVETNVPSTVVWFLKSILPAKGVADLYTAIGFHKHGKTQFYRDFLSHLQHSSDCFVPAPGTKGMVMVVFTLLSYPYVFKVIKDRFKPPKNTTRADVMAKYHLIKKRDRVGRMADVWEYSYAAFPLARFTEELIAELRSEAPSNLLFEGDQIVIKHLYIERRLRPLDLYVETANDGDLRHVICEYGDAIRDMAAADIFPGDLLFKNFGVTAYGRVIFYDYDEIVPMREVRIRAIPPPRFPEDELAAEPWYSVEENDVFPEEFGAYLLQDPRVRDVFMHYHAALLEPRWWQDIQTVIRAGGFPDLFPYPQAKRFNQRQLPSL
ncbi:MAG: isocitrate dehydrogenase [Gammaproteobacteria bacterium SG8_47]|nr:MAG: isocitrate dehydrogenase [Gammaproteobacteria bacterium SG8_47]